jgi:hypothetical protein
LTFLRLKGYREQRLRMAPISSREAARKLGLSPAVLTKYLKAGKIPAPETITSGRMTLHLWTEPEIERVRKLLPKIKNGRKTRYLKSKKSEARSQKSEKTTTKKKPQPRAAAQHNKKK